MSYPRKDCVAMILKFLEDKNFEETAHTLERESGLFFNLEYFEELALNGEWNEAEKYMSGFTKIEDNKFSTKIYFEMRKQKYLETLDKREHDKAVEILSNDLKVFAQYNSELYKEMALLITVDDFRKHASLTKYGDTRSARASIFREIKKGIEANPVFQGKLRVPAVDARVGQWSLQMSNLQI
ncbi:hypothetical protein AAG906_017591 [Vitis piasezkii]